MLDAAAGGTALLAGVALLRVPENESDDAFNIAGEGHLAGEFGGLLIAAGFAVAISSVYGFSEVSTCRAAADPADPKRGGAAESPAARIRTEVEL